MDRKFPEGNEWFEPARVAGRRSFRRINSLYGVGCDSLIIPAIGNYRRLCWWIRDFSPIT